MSNKDKNPSYKRIRKLLEDSYPLRTKMQTLLELRGVTAKRYVKRVSKLYIERKYNEKNK